MGFGGLGASAVNSPDFRGLKSLGFVARGVVSACSTVLTPSVFGSVGLLGATGTFGLGREVTG